jgi:uncharacterized membrane protein
MFYLPPVPSWNALHPLIVHFPIALLFVAPLFVILGIVVGPLRGRAFLVSALILMALGTASIFVALETGEAASELVRCTSAAREVLRQHQDLAETTEVLFTLLTVVLAVLLCALHHRQPLAAGGRGYHGRPGVAGHVSIDTTCRYKVKPADMKPEALEKFYPFAHSSQSPTAAGID